MSSHGIMSSKKANNSPGLCPVKGQKPSLNFTFTILKCLKCRNKGKDHDSQTQRYFIKFLKCISDNMGYMFRSPTLTRISVGGPTMQ
jgi:hypothetical protein